MVRQSAAEESADVRAEAPLLVEALGNVAHLPIRNSGTVGGSIAHADPSAELPAAVLALDATMVAAGPGGDAGSPLRTSSEARSRQHWDRTRSSRRYASRAVRWAVMPSSSSPGRTQLRRRRGRGRGHRGRGGCRHPSRHRAERGRTTPVRATATEEALVGTTPDAASIALGGGGDHRRLSPAGDVHGSSETKVDAARAACGAVSSWRWTRAATRR